MSGATRAVLWDFGGVITSSPFEAFNRFETDHGLPRDFIRRVNATNGEDNAWARLERAEIDAMRFDRLFEAESAALGHAIPGRHILPLLAGTIRPRMVAALRTCRSAGLRLGCITNNARVGEGPGMTADADKAADIAAVMAHFDHVIESSKAGVRKPDPRIYLMMCEQLGVAPETCIYLDDLGINCKPAAKLGMRAIKVEDEAQALAALAALTGLIF